jgi:hypothetical protein
VKRGEFFLTKRQLKKTEPKITVLIHELLSFTLYYLMLAPWWYQSFKSLFTDSSHAKFDHHLPLFSLPARLITPLQIGASVGIRWICPNHLKRYCTSLSSTDATPSLSCMSSFWTRFLLVWPQIYRSMHISATLSCWIYHILIDQYYSPWNMTDLTQLILDAKYFFGFRCIFFTVSFYIWTSILGRAFARHVIMYEKYKDK